MKNPKVTITPELADTILQVHHNGAFQIDCPAWEKLYHKARVVVARQQVEDSQQTLDAELKI